MRSKFFFAISRVIVCLSFASLPLVILAVVCGILSVSIFPSINFAVFTPLSSACFCILAPTLFQSLNRFRGCYSILLGLCFFGWFLFGVSWGVYSGHHIIKQQLHDSLEGKEFLVEGIVSDLPQEKQRYKRFRFTLVDSLAKRDGENQLDLPKQILLSWYGAGKVSVGDRWQLSVKLKRPRGSVNEGGFDYQRWLLSQGVGATGYVRKSSKNILLEHSNNYKTGQLREQFRNWILTSLSTKEPHTKEQHVKAKTKKDNKLLQQKKSKQDLKEAMNEPSPEAASNLLVALAVGDNSLISHHQWQQLRSTGTGHLMAISGLHIGLVATFGFWLGIIFRGMLLLMPIQFIFLLFSYGAKRKTKTRLVVKKIFRYFFLAVYSLPTLFSVMFAASYAALAGFGLPTQRALIMVIVANIAIVSYRKTGTYIPLLWALLFVVLIDPLAGYDLGFWLSFSAVAFLIYGFNSRINFTGKENNNKDDGIGVLPQSYFFSHNVGKFIQHTTNRIILGFCQFSRAQWIVFLGLFIPLVLLNQSSSLLSPIANFFAIPWVSITVVIPLLISISLSVLADVFSSRYLEFIAIKLLEVVNTFMSLCWDFLGKLDVVYDGIDLNYFYFGGSFFSTWYSLANRPSGFLLIIAAVLAIIGIVIFLSPKGTPSRWLGVVLLIPLFFPGRFSLPLTDAGIINQAGLIVTVLDVGQGLSVVVQVDDYTLLYDAGPGNPDGFNSGQAIVIPFLRARSIKKINTVIVSHNDNDHVGGLAPILASIPVDSVIYGQPNFLMKKDRDVFCDKNSRWRWHDVVFDLIEPIGLTSTSDKNNQSCILMITYKGHHIIIPGDIEKQVEGTLLRNNQLPKNVELLIAPHHGSRTSSTFSFVHHLNPEAIVYSAGYNSRYGHPHPMVVERYKSIASSMFNTGEMGQIQFLWNSQGEMSTRRWRKDYQRYWYDTPE